jgi:hypothetical protein
MSRTAVKYSFWILAFLITLNVGVQIGWLACRHQPSEDHMLALLRLCGRLHALSGCNETVRLDALDTRSPICASNAMGNEREVGGSFWVGVTVLTVVAAVSAWIPARRAARIDPLIALREP